MTLATLVAKAAGAGKELLVAYQFGTRPELGAFLFAYLFPAALVNILSASLQVALVPRYLAVLARSGPAEAAALGARVVGMSAIGLTAFCLLATPVFAYVLPELARGFDAETVRLARVFLVLLMPIVVLSGVASLWSGLLNAERQYTFTSLVPLATPICVAVALFVAVPQIGAYALVLGTMIGALAEASFLGARLRRATGPLWSPVAKPGADEREVGRQFGAVAGSNVLMAGSTVVEQSFAASLSAASVAAYSYGTRLTTVAAGVLVTVLSTMLLPHFSRLQAAADRDALRRAVVRVGLAIALLVVPMAALLSVGADTITRLFYERGQFTASDTALVAGVQSAHAWYAPVYALSMVAVRFLNAVEASRVFLVGSSLNLAASIALNVWLVPRYGVLGIAWANVGMYAASAIFLWACVWRVLSVRSKAGPAG